MAIAMLNVLNRKYVVAAAASGRATPATVLARVPGTPPDST